MVIKMNHTTIRYYILRGKISILVLFLILSTFIAFIPFTNASHVLKSEWTNGWEVQNSSTMKILRGVSFADHNTGIAVGGDYWEGVIVRTTDGGQTWGPTSRSIPEDPDPPLRGLWDVSLFDSNIGTAVGYDGIIAYTTDCFTTREIVQPIGSICTYYGIQSLSPDFECAVGTSSLWKALAVLTHDRWKTYQSYSFWLMHPNEPWGFDANLHDVCFVNSNVGFAVSGVCYGQGAVVRSVNGGVDWTTVFWDDYRSLIGVDFPSENVGYAVGENGIIIKTADGGDNWQYLTSGVGVRLWDVSFTSEKVGTVVGENGVILRTRDGGENWHLQYTGIHTNLYAVDFIDSLNGWIAGDGGLILHTNTGGYTLSVSLRP